MLAVELNHSISILSAEVIVKFNAWVVPVTPPFKVTSPPAIIVRVRALPEELVIVASAFCVMVVASELDEPVEIVTFAELRAVLILVFKIVDDDTKILNGEGNLMLPNQLIENDTIKTKVKNVFFIVFF